MKVAVIGSEGFIGSAIMRNGRKFWVNHEFIGINRENYDRWVGYKFDTIIWAAGSASKELCEDVETAKQVNAYAVEEAVRKFPHDRFVYISSQAVYPDKYALPDERVEIDPYALSNYGKSKYLGETIVKTNCESHLIVRPNGFSGPGLKKNAIYFLGQPEPKLYYTWDSYAQYMHVEVFSDILIDLAIRKLDNMVINLTSPDPIGLVKIADLLGVEKDNVPPCREPLPHVRAAINTSEMLRLLASLGYTRSEGITSVYAVRYWNQATFRYV